MGLPFSNPACFPAYTPPQGAVQMTQAWQEERESKRGWGAVHSLWLKLERKPSNHLCMTNWGTGGRIHSVGL